MLKRVITLLWGDFDSTEELKKFGFLASIFCIIIGIYWAMRPMKDSIFDAIVGMDYQPVAKWLSLGVIIPLVLIYSKLIDMFSRDKVFYFLISIYAIAALAFMWAFMDPQMGLSNTVQSSARITGWLWYIYVESFGSLIVALFWAFTTDTTMPESAKRGFPVIALFGQLGNIFGPLLLDAQRLGVSTTTVVGIVGLLMVAVGFIFWLMMVSVDKKQLQGFHEEGEKDKEPGFFEGLTLLLTKGYLFGIFMIITIYEIIVTVLDFHFKATAAYHFRSTLPADEVQIALNNYLNQYAIMTGIVASICVILGINNIQRRLGMRASLITLPMAVAVAVLGIKLYPQGMSLAFWIMVLSKAVNYALNQPTLKQLYIPTTRDTKYKSQAWIEMFGSRGSKAVGSGINIFRKVLVSKWGAVAGVSAFLTVSSLISFGLIGLWLFVAVYVSRVYNKAIAENRVVC